MEYLRSSQLCPDESDDAEVEAEDDDAELLDDTDATDGEIDSDEFEASESESEHVEISNGWTRVGSLMVPTAQAKVIDAQVDDESDGDDGDASQHTESVQSASLSSASQDDSSIAAALATSISGSTKDRSEKFDWSAFDDDDDDDGPQKPVNINAQRKRPAEEPKRKPNAKRQRMSKKR